MEGLLASLTFGMDVRDAAFRSALAADRAALQQTERQFQSSGAGMSNAMVGTAREVNRAALAMVESFNRAVDQVKAKGVAMTVALTVPLGLLAHKSKDTASSFEEAMNRVQAAMLTAKPEQLQKLAEAALTLGPALGRSAIEAADAIIFVVDSADTERMPVAKGELAAMLEEDELKESILLVFANKQDQKGAMNAQQISDALGLPEIRNRQWSIQETSALKGKGLFEGFDWLVTCIKGTDE